MYDLLFSDKHLSSHSSDRVCKSHEIRNGDVKPYQDQQHRIKKKLLKMHGRNGEKLSLNSCKHVLTLFAIVRPLKCWHGYTYYSQGAVNHRPHRYCYRCRYRYQYSPHPLIFNIILNLSEFISCCGYDNKFSGI
uniref:Uncharacterized protein n=1 Tax=Glossina pallidipes TaxID=7398 RepID=A0A1A9ZSN9_GLOPL